MNIEIIAETKWWIAVNKPAGLNVEQLHDFPSLEQWVGAYQVRQGVRKPYVGIVHRLDRPVSGVLLVAKKKAALKILNEQFREKKIAKVYWAVVEGRPSASGADLRHYLIKDQQQKRAFANDNPRKGAIKAELSYQLLHSKADRCLLEVRPHSGKFHQIRVQLSAAGHPIVGDEKYGAAARAAKDQILLHARQLSFFDPQSGEAVQVTAKLPGDRYWEGWTPG